MKTYMGDAERSGNWWAFSIPEISGAHGQVKRLDQVVNEARDLISLIAVVEADSTEVELFYEMRSDD
jgi:hypothetical protein